MSTRLNLLTGPPCRRCAPPRNAILAGVLEALTLGFLAVGSGHADILHCTGDEGYLVTVDQSNGAAVWIGPSGLESTAAAWAPSGELYGIMNWGDASSQLMTYNLSTGAGAPVGEPFGVSLMIALEISSNGTCYGGTWAYGSNLFRIDLATGAATLIGSTGFDWLVDFAFDSRGVLWAVNPRDLWTIETNTGASIHQATITGTGPVGGIMFDATDVLYAIDSTPRSSLYTIDTSTGVATLVGNTRVFNARGGDFRNDRATPTQAPTWGQIKGKYRQ